MFTGKRAGWTASVSAWLALCLLAGAAWAREEGWSTIATAAETANLEAAAAGHALESIEQSSGHISAADLREFVVRLASREYEGRGTGLTGERLATAYVSGFFEGVGLQGAGEGGGWFQEFPVEVGMEMRGTNTASIELELSEEPRIAMELNLEMSRDAQPVGFSRNAKFDSSALVFAGFGLRTETYDSYEGLDVENKWVVVFRAVPSSGARELARGGPLLVKARLAQKLGAAGILFVKGGADAVAAELVDLSLPMGGNDLLPAMSITNEVAGLLLKRVSNEGLEATWDAYDRGARVKGFDLDAVVKGEIELRKAVATGRNTLGRFIVGDRPSEEVIVIGAHVDHLGFGNRGASRAVGSASTEMHVGADDNASGVAALMDIAQKLAQMKKNGTLNLRRDVVFGAWSGEEMGLYGSKHFVAEWQSRAGAEKISAYLNMDMVGRWKENGLILHGMASSSQWELLVEKATSGVDLRIQKNPSPFLPTDMVSFYQAGVPVLAGFTGLHDDYHKPTDTAEKLDYEGVASIAEFMLRLTLETAGDREALDYVELDRKGRPIEAKQKVGETAAEGEIPEGGEDAGQDHPPMAKTAPPKLVLGIFFGGAENDGLVVGGVSPDSAAAEAGLDEGDVISKLNGKDIRSSEDLLEALQGMEPDKSYPLEYLREGQRRVGAIKPRAR